MKRTGFCALAVNLAVSFSIIGTKGTSSRNISNEGEQVVHLAFGYGEVAFFQVGFAVQPSAMQEAECGEDGAERCLHVVYHGVGEVFAYLENLVHLRDDADLVDDAGDDKRQDNQ